MAGTTSEKNIDPAGGVFLVRWISHYIYLHCCNIVDIDVYKMKYDGNKYIYIHRLGTSYILLILYIYTCI